MTVRGLSHIGVSVASMERSLAFYRDVLGLPVYFDERLDRDYLHRILQVPFTAIRIARLRVPGGSHIELLEYQGCEKAPRLHDPSQPAAGHLALEVDDVADVHARASRYGFPPLTPSPVLVNAGVNAGWIAAYLTDPDGYFVEVVQRPKDAESVGSGSIPWGKSGLREPP
jgi:lactoylglutathione lyase